MLRPRFRREKTRREAGLSDAPEGSAVRRDVSPLTYCEQWQTSPNYTDPTVARGNPVSTGFHIDGVIP